MIGHILSSEKLSLEGSAQSGVVPDGLVGVSFRKRSGRATRGVVLVPAELVAISLGFFSSLLHCNQLAL